MNQVPVRRSTIPSLTGIRILAAMAVFFLHFGAAFSERLGMPRAMCQLLRNGYMGVSVFFVLSGFIMTYTYEGHLMSKRELMDFAWARFSRIYPVYVLVLVLTLPVLERPIDVLSAVKVLFMVQSWTSSFSFSGFSWAGQAWTLSVELFFYLMFPILSVATRNIHPKWLVLMFVPTGVFIVYFGIPTITPGSDDRVHFRALELVPLPLFRFCEFVYGFLLCKCLFAFSGTIRAIARPASININALLIIAILCSQNAPKAMGCVTLLVGLFLLQLAIGDGWIPKLLSKPIMVLFGGASYSFYLLQGPVGGWVHWLVPEAFVRPLLFGLTLLGSLVVYKFYEEPARRLIKDFSKRASETPKA